MQYHYVPDVQVSSNVDFNFSNLGEQPSEPKAPTFVQVQRETANADLSTGEAFWNSWLYGGTLGAIYNGITKPGISDDGWVKNQKLSAWQQARRILGPAVQHQDFRNYWEDNIKSAYDAKWFIDAAQNKIAANAAMEQHTLAAIGAQFLDPVDALVPFGMGKVAKVKKLYEAINGLSGLKRVSAFGAIGAGAGVATEIPQVLWNFQDESSIIAGAALSASLYAFAGRLTDKQLKKLANRKRIAQDKPPEKAFEQALKEQKVLQEVPDHIKVKTPDDVPEGIQDEIPEIIDDVVDDSLGEVPEYVRADLPNDIPDDIIDDVAKGVPDDIDSYMDDVVQNTVQEASDAPKRGAPTEAPKAPQSEEYKPIETGNDAADELINAPRDPKTQAPAKDPRMSWFKRLANSFIGLNSEVHALWGELAEKTMSLPYLGTRGTHGAISIAQQNNNFITAQHLTKFQEGLRKIKGWFPQGAKGNAKALYSKDSLLSQSEKEQAMRQAQGYLASMYNRESSLNAINNILERIKSVIGEEATIGLSPDSLSKQIHSSEQNLRELVKKANAQIRKRNEQVRLKYEQAVQQYSRTSQLKGPDGKYPKRPQKPKYQDQIEFESDLYAVQAQPDLSAISPLAQQVVKAYVDSGISRALSKVLRESGQNLIESDHYMHLAIDAKRFDQLAKAQARVVQARSKAELGAIEKQIKTLRTSMRNQQAYLKNNPNAKDAQAVKQRLKTMNEELSGLYKRRSQLNHMGPDDYLMQAYDDVTSDYGQQVWNALQKAKGSEFKHVTKSQIGALLVVSRIKDIGGHDALFRFLKNQRKAMGDNLNAKILRQLEQATNVQFNQISPILKEELDLAPLVYHATAERRSNPMQVIGASNMLKRRYRQDYMKAGSKCGIAPYQFLQGDMYGMSQKMIKEETSRASLMGIRIIKPDAVPDKNGNYKLQDIIDLGTPQGLTRAARNLHDRAVAAGYTDATAQDIADSWLNSVLGRPIGDPEEDWLQVLRAVAGTMFLKNSGLFNLADVAQMCLDFSYTEVAKAMLPAMQMGFTFGKISKGDMNTISGMLAKTLSAEGRLVPQIKRVGEDLQDVSKSRWVAAAHYFSQYGRFANASEFIRNWQNNMGALIYQTRLLQALRKGQYLDDFIPREVMDLAMREYKKHGQNFGKWDESAKRAVIGAGDSIMANIILSIRAGERPRFLSTTMGRAIFAYQSFVFAAHQKLLMRYKNNYGMLKLTHLLLTQMTAGVGIVALAKILEGKDPTQLTPEQFGVQLGTSVSALGLLGSAVTAISRGQIGGTTPSLSAATNIASLPYNIVTGDFQQASKGVPLLSIFVPFRAVLAATTGEF